MKKQIIVLLALLNLNLAFGQSWNQIVVPSNNKLNDIDFPSSNVGYIGGDNETLLKSTDGGRTWDTVSFTGINVGGTFHFLDLDFATEDIGFAVIGQFIGLYKTVDGGSTWVAMDDMELGNFCYRNALYVNSEDHFFAGGAGCFQSAMIKEYNNGTWSEKPDNHETFDPSEYVRQIDFRGNLGLAATNGYYFLRSTDAGQTWDTIPSNLSAGFLTSVVIKDDTLAYAGYDALGGGFGILKSEDAGLTWQEDFNSATFFYPAYNCVAVANNGDVYSGAASTGWPGGLMFETTDGVNWSYEPVDQATYSMDSYGDDITFAVGDSGYVIVNTDPAILGLSDLENDEMKVSIFPNPNNGVFEVSTGESKLETIRICDYSGRTIATFENIYDEGFIINAQNLTSGLYQLLLTTESGIISRSFVVQ